MKARLKHYWKNLIIILNKKELAFLPGQLAFFFVLSIIPILIILFLTAGWLNLSVDIITNFIKDSFSQKRKTLKNNLKEYDWRKILDILHEFGYNDDVRAEALPIEIFAMISNRL